MGQMSGDFGKGKQLLLVISPLQACILLLFNAQSKLTFKEVYQNLWPGEASGSQLRSSSNSSAIIDIKLDDQLRHAIQPLIAGAATGPKERVCLLATAGDMDKLTMDDSPSVTTAIAIASSTLRR